MKGLTNIEHSFTEREEVKISRIGRRLAESRGRDEFVEILLSGIRERSEPYNIVLLQGIPSAEIDT